MTDTDVREILAAAAWRSNADLIADLHTLGHLRDEWLTVDVTYGRGAWWSVYEPEGLVKHDLALDGVDFTDLPYQDNEFDVVAYDPPYVCVGGRKTTGMGEMYERYGQLDTPKRPVELQLLINDGLIEALRVARKRVLVKCQDYVSGGKLFPGTHYTLSCALEHGAELLDRIEYVVNRPRPQPKGRTQKHARRNLSTMFVLKPAKERKR